VIYRNDESALKLCERIYLQLSFRHHLAMSNHQPVLNQFVECRERVNIRIQSRISGRAKKSREISVLALCVVFFHRVFCCANNARPATRWIAKLSKAEMASGRGPRAASPPKAVQAAQNIAVKIRLASPQPSVTR
jgi:hypothetical protein